MNWMDLLRMSSSSLKRRKLRTFLTVLGVVIGTASIVVMISLGLGMQESMYREIEQSGGATNIRVTGAEVGDSMMYYGGGDGEEESTKYISDDLIKDLGDLEHVTSSYPVYEMSSLLLKGRYEGYIQLAAMDHESLVDMNIPLESGELPSATGSALDLLYGNGTITMFYDTTSNEGYYETYELPDIDLTKDSMFLILDMDAYFQSQATDVMQMGGDSTDGEGESSQKKTASKYVVKGSGVVAGGPEEYTAYYNYVYCDLGILKQMLKKEYAGQVIPGQPSTKSGKPYKEFYYTYANVQVDEMDNVDAVANQIRSMGYNVETNAEYLNSMKSQFAIIQAVLGGIGAVSLLVAAIGIANTMVMSIYERTKEIGVIKVLGCSLKNIKQLFLMEAAFIGLLGGVVGNILSFIMSAVINVITGNGAMMGMDGNISYIPWWLVLLSIGFALFVGVGAGYFPALRAMRLSPLEAIRSE